jgi:hypothetical protein
MAIWISSLPGKKIPLLLSSTVFTDTYEPEALPLFPSPAATTIYFSEIAVTPPSAKSRGIPLSSGTVKLDFSSAVERSESLRQLRVGNEPDLGLVYLF